MDLAELMDQVVITPSKTLQKVSEAPGTVIVVTKQQIRERGYFNLVDLLEDLPSIDVQRQSRPTTINRIAFRGNQGNFKFIIMQNGFRISAPTTENVGVDYNFPVFHAEQVEVIYSPSSALYGRDAFTGTINIITKKAKTINGAEISSSFGTDDFFYDYLNFGKALNSKIDLTLGGHWQKSQNPDLSDTYPDRYQGFQQDLLNPDNSVFKTAATRGDRYIGDTGSYSAYAELDILKKLNLGYTRSFLNNPSTINANPVRALFTKDSRIKTLMESYHGKYKFEVNPKLSGISSIDYLHFELLPSSKFTNDVAGFGVNNGFKFADGKRLNIEQQLNYEINENHQLIAGVNFQYFNRLPRTADLPRKYDPSKNPEDQGLLYPNTNIPILFFPKTFQNYGVYIQAQSKWNDWLTTTIGTRFDYDTRFRETFNPRAGATIKLRKDTIFKMLYSEAFLAPSPRAFNHFGSFDGSVNGNGLFQSFFFFIPNPDLKPEKSRTIEANLTHNITKDFIVSLSGYFTRVTSFVEGVSSNKPSFFIPGAIIFNTARFENSASANIFGGDLRVDYQRNFNRYNLKLWANYSWVDGHIDSGDGTMNPLPQVSRNKIKTGFTLSYLDKYFITPRFFWIGKAPISSNVGEKTDPYGVAHLYAGVNDIFKNVSAFINIRNILDIKYFNVGRDNNRDFDRSPQNPRRIMVGLKYKF